MAEIRPLRAWRYNHALAQQIEVLTSPLFDVVSAKQREALYRNPFNSIHLSVPTGEHAHDKAAELLHRWKNSGVLTHDVMPAIYVYYQHFSLAGQSRQYCRKGFICNIKAYDWKENVVLRHESTLPNAVGDRLALLEKTELNVSPTHGLYTDPHHELEALMDEAMKAPLYETEDYQGVRDVLAVIQDVNAIKKFVQVLSDKQVILADGHHRYESSLAYRKAQTAANPDHTGQEAYNYHLMYLTNTESEDLRILPTHRLVRNMEGFDTEVFLEKLSEYFNFKTIEDACMMPDIIAGKKWAFGLVFNDRAYKITLKPDKVNEIDWNFPQAIKELDLTVLHYFILEKVLNIYRKEQTRSPHLLFERNFTECVSQVNKGLAQVAIITSEVSMDDVKRVCQLGHTMPPKATYFYPKVICGFVFSSIKQKEFESIADEVFSI